MLPIGPIWSVLHVALKYPAVTAVAVTGYMFVDLSPVSQITVDRTVSNSGAMVALTFDDGWKSVHEIALPAMRTRGMVGTNYISSGFVDSGPEYITRNHIKDFVAAGWEIGAHTINHDNLVTLENWQIEENMIVPQSSLREWSDSEVTAFSSPFGSFNDTVIRFAEVTYNSHVNAWSDAAGLNTLENFDLFNIHRLDTHNASVESVCETVATLGDDNFYVIIFHKIDNSGSDYSLTPKDFDAILDCVGDSDVQVVTVSDGAESMLERLAL